MPSISSQRVCVLRFLFDPLIFVSTVPIKKEMILTVSPRNSGDCRNSKFSRHGPPSSLCLILGDVLYKEKVKDR